MSNKYKVGDKVKIRADLESGKKYGADVFVGRMKDFSGEIVTIKSIGNNGDYTIKEDECGYWFTEEMIECCQQFQIKDVFKLKYKGEKFEIEKETAWDNRFISEDIIKIPEGVILSGDKGYYLKYENDEGLEFTTDNNRPEIIQYYSIPGKNVNDEYKLVRCEVEDIRVGDRVYVTDSDEIKGKGFNHLWQICVNEDYHGGALFVYVDKTYGDRYDLLHSTCGWEYYYKVVRRTEDDN